MKQDGRLKGTTYEVDLGRVGELLFSVGTFRRICGRENTVSEGFPHTSLTLMAHERNVMPIKVKGRTREYIPGARVLCST